MDKLFEIIFLDEAFAFLKGLDRKHYEKILTIFVKHRLNTTRNYLRNSITTFGSLEHYTKDINTDYLHFGTKLLQ